MDGFEKRIIGTVPLLNFEKPKLFWDVDPKLFLPMGILFMGGVIFFHGCIGFPICWGLGFLIFLAGRVMASWSPFFIDESMRWLSWRMRTGSNSFAADAYFFSRDSDEAKKWR